MHRVYLTFTTLTRYKRVLCCIKAKTSSATPTYVQFLTISKRPSRNTQIISLQKWRQVHTSQVKMSSPGCKLESISVRSSWRLDKSPASFGFLLDLTIFLGEPYANRRKKISHDKKKEHWITVPPSSNRIYELATKVEKGPALAT